MPPSLDAFAVLKSLSRHPQPATLFLSGLSSLRRRCNASSLTRKRRSNSSPLPSESRPPPASQHKKARNVCNAPGLLSMLIHFFPARRHAWQWITTTMSCPLVLVPSSCAFLLEPACCIALSALFPLKWIPLTGPAKSTLARMTSPISRAIMKIESDGHPTAMPAFAASEGRLFYFLDGPAYPSAC